MMGYTFVGIAVVMFGFMFLFSSKYEKLNGNKIRAILTYTAGSYTVGFLILLIINNFKIEFTLFSVLVALLSAVNLLLYNFCSIKALGKINLSLYSVFAMLGGMALPFVAGIAFFHEELTLGKSICIITIALSLFLTVEKGNNKGGYIYYAGVFVFNGMSGVISKFYSTANYNKASEAGYSVQIALCAVLICLVLLAFNKEEKIKLSIKSAGCIFGNGFLGNIGNFLLLLGLKKLPASAQYPFVTGGVMIVSTVIAFFTPNKPKKKEIIAVALSFIGILALVLLP